MRRSLHIIGFVAFARRIMEEARFPGNTRPALLISLLLAVLLAVFVKIHKIKSIIYVLFFDWETDPGMAGEIEFLWRSSCKKR